MKCAPGHGLARYLPHSKSPTHCASVAKIDSSTLSICLRINVGADEMADWDRMGRIGRRSGRTESRTRARRPQGVPEPRLPGDHALLGRDCIAGGISFLSHQRAATAPPPGGCRKTGPDLALYIAVNQATIYAATAEQRRRVLIFPRE